MNHCRLETMSEYVTNSGMVKEELVLECRTCLEKMSTDAVHYIFQAWVPPWEGVENTIAEALEKIAHIQPSEMDQHSKVICVECCQKLHSACLFATLAQQSDFTLRQRYLMHVDTLKDETWPKPIQIDKNVPISDQLEVKQEVLSDEESSIDYYRSGVGQNNLLEYPFDIKIEPVELIQQNAQSELNGHQEGSTLPDRSSDIAVNGDSNSQEHFSMTVKEEPISDSESVGTDLSLDCMLCAKEFNSVSGLKAHVIAQHSYKSVRRKASHESSPVKRKKRDHVCATCRRTFSTSTDLMVHETCHNKSVCYGCNEKFDSFELVMQHRMTCKAVTNRPAPLKTLEDVQRPQRPSSSNSDETPKRSLKCALCEETFTDDYYMNIHMEIHHPRPDEVEVEVLESMFSERA